MSAKKSIPYLFFITAIIVTIANIYIWYGKIISSRETTYKCRSVAYASLYYPKRVPAILGFERPDRDRLILKLSDNSFAGWKILPDSTLPYRESSSFPLIRLLPRLHTYQIIADSAARSLIFTIKIDYCPEEIYAHMHNSSPDNYLIVYSSLPIGQFQQYRIKEFALNDEISSAEEISAAGKILEDRLHISQCRDMQSRIAKIGAFLLSQLADKEGIPADGMDTRTPFQQYQYAISDRSKIWCTNYAKIFAFFATAGGIPTRLVSVGGTLNGIYLSGHAFTECFVPETQQWAFVDLASRKLCVKNNEGDLLNTIELFYLNLAKSFDGMQACIVDSGQVKWVPYATVSASEQYYFTKDASFIYKRKNPAPSFISSRKLRKAMKVVIKPDLAYSLNGSNWNNFFVRLLSYGELLIAAMGAMMGTKHAFAGKAPGKTVQGETKVVHCG